MSTEQAMQTQEQAQPSAPIGFDMDSMIAEVAAELQPKDEAPKQQEAAPQTEQEKSKEEPKDPVAAIMASAVRREREAKEAADAARKARDEVTGKEKRYTGIESKLKNKDWLGAIRELAPDVDPSAFVVEALELLGKEDKPLTQEEIRKAAREEFEREYQAREEAKRKAQEEAKAKQDEAIKQAFEGYMGSISTEAAAKADEYPILSNPKVLRAYADDIRAYAKMEFDRTGAVPSVKAILDQLEAEVGDKVVTSLRSSKRHGSAFAPKQPEREPNRAQVISLASAAPGKDTGAVVRRDPGPASIDDEFASMIDEIKRQVG